MIPEVYDKMRLIRQMTAQADQMRMDPKVSSQRWAVMVARRDALRRTLPPLQIVAGTDRTGQEAL